MFTSFQRTMAALSLALAVAAPAMALPGLSVLSLLGRASDSALDKLAKPGAFYADEAVRIALPGPLKGASGLMRLADSAGLTNGFTRTLNDAAGVAAGQAKPIFRDAISKMTLADGVGIVSANDGGTQYLKRSAGETIRGKIRPLVASALAKAGAYKQFEKLGRLGGAGALLSAAGVSADGLTDSVAEQTTNGIFTYMGREEARVRADPLRAGASILKGLNN